MEFRTLQIGDEESLEMLRRSLPICAQLGITRALITCDEGNVGSQKVIEKCGGVFEGIIQDPGNNVPKRRYWIDTLLPLPPTFNQAIIAS